MINSVGMKKTKEVFLFFSINDPLSFKFFLRNEVAKFLTSAQQLMKVATRMYLVFVMLDADTRPSR